MAGMAQTLLPLVVDAVTGIVAGALVFLGLNVVNRVRGAVG
jgi:hypothetical protein